MTWLLSVLMVGSVNQVIAAEIAKRGQGAGRALAEACGVTTETVSKWKHGKSQPEAFRWTAIERHFKLRLGTLSRAAGQHSNGGAHTVAELSATVEALRAEVEALRTAVAESRHEMR